MSVPAEAEKPIMRQPATMKMLLALASQRSAALAPKL